MRAASMRPELNVGSRRCPAEPQRPRPTKPCPKSPAATPSPHLHPHKKRPERVLNPTHPSKTSMVGTTLTQTLATTLYAPLVPQEMAPTAGDGDLLAHYQAPLVDGPNNAVYMMGKSGTFDPNDYSTQTWFETKYTWSGSSLSATWAFTTDWKAPGSLNNDFWEPVFHPALANDFLYVPGVGGTNW